MSPRNTYYLAGLFFCFQVLAIIRNIASSFFSFFWFCDFVSGVIALCFLTKNVQAVKGIGSVGLFGQLGYVVVIFVRLLYGITLFGFSIDFPLTPAYLIPTLIIHTSTLVAFSMTFRIKPERRSLAYSFGFLVLVYGVVMLFGHPSADPVHNYNFIVHSGLFGNVAWYTQLWIPITFFLVALPSYLFQLGVWYLFETRHTKHHTQ